ncbi:MAG: helicase-related protein, partial [Novosphingobium sp.]
RLLHARGREETMLLGAATLAPLVRALVPQAEIVSRPRFSTLSHIGAKKLSRVPPRSAIVAFSAEQVYAVAEMLRRFRGGAAVVMGALSPRTRNAQVAMFQSGEVDYIVATDAIGMGLNLDISHVAFAGLSKFDGHRQRRLFPAEMAQIAGRAGRHQRDGSFGTLSGAGGRDAEFTLEEIFAIEEHRFPPLARLFWREAEPRFDSVATLIADLEAAPRHPALAPAPQAVDLAVLKLLADDPAVAGAARGSALVRRLWQACSLPDFRQLGPEQHARFVARLWQDLSAGSGHLGGDYVARAIAELDRPDGDIHALQARIAAIRSWAYIAQRPDWVIAREEMAERARAAEARLSDALHARLTERFVNRRTAVLMRNLGPDAALLPVRLADNATVLVDDEPIGTLAGFRFRVDPQARAADRKLLLAAAERHLPRFLEERVEALLAALAADPRALEASPDGALEWDGEPVARIERGRGLLRPRLRLDPALAALPAPVRDRAATALDGWLEARIASVLAPLRALEQAGSASGSGPALRALALRLVEGGGIVARAGAGLDGLDPEQRERLRQLGVRAGALDLFVPTLLRPAPLALWAQLARAAGLPAPPPAAAMPPVLAAPGLHAGYRRVGREQLRVDMADKLVRVAHGARRAAPRRRFALDPALARSMGLTTAGFAALLHGAGFRAVSPRPLRDGQPGPPAPPLWEWRPPRPPAHGEPPRGSTLGGGEGAFAALAGWGAE